jgi:dihydrofolate reductase
VGERHHRRRGPHRDDHKLKAEPGGDLIGYGGGTLVRDLIARELVDEIHLFMNPTAIGAGIPVFGDRTKLRLAKSTPFECGITAMHYAPARA